MCMCVSVCERAISFAREREKTQKEREEEKKKEKKKREGAQVARGQQGRRSSGPCKDVRSHLWGPFLKGRLGGGGGGAARRRASRS